VQTLAEVNWRGDVRISPDGRYVAAYREESGTTIWDIQTGHLSAALPVRGIWSAFSPDGRQLFTSDAHELCVWEVGAWTKLRCIRATTDRIAASPDGRLLAARTGLSRIQLLHTETLEEVAALEFPGMAPHSFAFSSDGTLLAAFMARNLATVVWDLRRIRAELAEMGLDWELPAYPPPGGEKIAPLRLEIDPADRGERTRDFQRELQNS
jgi:WD40 repeat protein